MEKITAILSLKGNENKQEKRKKRYIELNINAISISCAIIL